MNLLQIRITHFCLAVISRAQLTHPIYNDHPFVRSKNINRYVYDYLSSLAMGLIIGHISLTFK